MYEPHGDTSEQKHTFPEPNTYDYASQLLFDANAFAAMSNQVDLNPAYMDFFQQGGADPYEMLRYQTAMQQSHDYASSCSSGNTPPSSYNHPQLQSQSVQYQQHPQAYPMMAFHSLNGDGISLEQANSTMNYPIPYDHHHHPQQQQHHHLQQQHQHHHHHHQQQQAYLFNHNGPMPTLSTSSSSSSSLSSTTAANSYGNSSENRGAQVYVRKACVSCKQSHVACDVQRPCARCVRLNKADTCVDAERKKRGRPCGSSKKKKEALVSYI